MSFFLLALLMVNGNMVQLSETFYTGDACNDAAKRIASKHRPEGGDRALFIEPRVIVVYAECVPKGKL